MQIWDLPNNGVSVITCKAEENCSEGGSIYKILEEMHSHILIQKLLD